MTSICGYPPTPPASVDAGSPSRKDLMPIRKRWWNINILQSQWTPDCPDYLRDQPEKNIQILSTSDDDHPRLTWAEVTHLIDTGRIDHFHRQPSELRRYLKYCYDLQKRYGSILYFMQHERLGWTTVEATGDAPFTNSADYKVLYNDWPYAIDLDVTHIVIWTKFFLEVDPVTEEVTSKTRDLIEDFILATFCSDVRDEARVDREHLRWFKNWTSLKSVHALEHVHVMLYKAPPQLLSRVTHGDKPMCEQFE